jgi:outer membrane receptor protein involved in Fe transport
LLSKPAAIRWGGDVRFDDIDEVGLYRTVERQQTGAIRRDRVKELSVSAYADVGIVLTEALRASFGLRADHFDWDVGALREANSGKGSETVFSPKLNLAYRLSDRHEIYANWGRGFHSNDVRGATIAIDPATGDPTDPVDSVARSIGAELGLRHESAESFNATLSVFWLELDSELVFVGDAGTTEPTDGSERVGVELSAFWQPTDWLAANFAYTYTDSKFKTDQGTGREVPGAIGSSAAVGVNAAWGNGAFAGLRVRYLGDAPLVEDGSVRSGDSLLVNARAGFRWNNLEFRLDVFNLLDSADYDISYYFASRLEGEPLGGVEDIHYHPLEPRILRASVTMFWGEPGTAPFSGGQ